MKYIDDLKLVGRCPQVDGFIKGYDPMAENGIFKIPLFTLPTFTPNLDGIKLYNKTKLTDIIYAGGMFHRGEIINKRVVEIFHNFNLCKHKIYNAKLYQKDKILEDYMVIIAEFDILPYIDYEKTEFYRYHGPSVKYLDRLKIDNADSYLIMVDKIINGPEGVYTYSVKHKGPIYLKPEFPNNLDYFVSLFIGNPTISERLKIALEEAKVTGVWFKEIVERLKFQ